MDDERVSGCTGPDDVRPSPSLWESESNQRAALDALLADNPQHRFAAGEQIMIQGEPAGWFAYLTAGTADVSRNSPRGEVHIGVAGPGSIVGELALITGAPRSATVTATTIGLVHSSFGAPERTSPTQVQQSRPTPSPRCCSPRAKAGR